MAEQRDDEKFGGERSQANQQPTGQDSQKNQDGEIGTKPEQGSGSMPPRSTGSKGNEFGQFGDSSGAGGQQGQSGTGQSDLGTQADAALAGRTDQQNLGTDRAGQVGGASGSGGGFIGSQGSGSDELIRQDQSTEEPTSESGGATDFASQGQGAIDRQSQNPTGPANRSDSDSEAEDDSNSF